MVMISPSVCYPAHRSGGPRTGLSVRRGWCRYRRSTFSCGDDGFGKRLRSLLRQIVPDAALDGPVRIFA
jgi:hypothetical protein